MQEAEIAKEALEKTYHWFFDAQVFWAALLAAIGATIGASALRVQVRSAEREAVRKETEHLEAIKLQIAIECYHNFNSARATLEQITAPKLPLAETFGYLTNKHMSLAYDTHFTDLGRLGEAGCYAVASAHINHKILSDNQFVSQHATYFQDLPENTRNNLTRAFVEAVETWKIAATALGIDVEEVLKNKS